MTVYQFYGICSIILLAVSLYDAVTVIQMHLRIRAVILSIVLSVLCFFVFEISINCYHQASVYAWMLRHACVLPVMILLITVPVAGNTVWAAYIWYTGKRDMSSEEIVYFSYEARARQIRIRLKAFLKMMQCTVMERELLDLKTMLHDSFGRGLLLAKRYLTMEEGDVAREPVKNELTSMWRENIKLLKNEEPEFWQKPYYTSIKHAELLGIRIVTAGTLPEDEGFIGIIDSAIMVSATNTLRHAYGHTVYIDVEKRENGVMLTFQNDGIQPGAEITEKGGLINLRQRVEKSGGSMLVTTEGGFKLRITLPEKPVK